jgi:predicted  nucleic acid-binding Zn-ribbon protein
MSESEESYRIVELRSENFKRLRAVRIRPDGNLVIIAGANEQGKSCVLDSIESTLGGEKHIPPEPVRKGKRRGHTIVDLGELVAERQYSKSGSKVVVKDADDTPQKGPQTILKELWTDLTFDPMEFVRMKATKQDEVLKQFLGLDFGEFDAKRAGAYAKRTDVNRDLKRVEAQLEAADHHDGVPEEEVSVAKLMAELERREEQQAANELRQQEAATLEQQAEAVRQAVVTAEQRPAELQRQYDQIRQEIEARIAELQRELAEHAQALKAELQANQERVDELLKEQTTREKLVTASREVVAALVAPDIDAVKQQITDAEETNRKVRDNLARRKLADELKQLEQQAKTFTDEITDIDEQKQEAIAKAKFPIEGLGFDDVGVTLDGVPFEQASTSQKIRASVAVGAALHPKLRVLLIRDGNDLDETRLRLLAEMAEELDLQIWIERIAGGPGAVVIEDGEVKGGETDEESPA